MRVSMNARSVLSSGCFDVGYDGGDVTLVFSSLSMAALNLSLGSVVVVTQSRGRPWRIAAE